MILAAVNARGVVVGLFCGAGPEPPARPGESWIEVSECPSVGDLAETLVGPAAVGPEQGQDASSHGGRAVSRTGRDPA